MAAEYKLSYTAKEIDEKLSKVGQPYSWNDLKDKPFGDEKVAIEWDGNTEGRVVVPFGDGDETSLVKVSDLTPEPDTFVGGSFGVTAEGEVGFMQITAETIEDFRSEGVNAIMVGGGAFFVIYADGTNVDRAVFPEKGIYFIYVDGVQYNSSLTYGSIKKLDPKFLPEGGVGYDETAVEKGVIEYDGDPTGKPTVVLSGDRGVLVKISDITPEPSWFVGSVWAVGDEELTITEEMIYDGRPDGNAGAEIAELIHIYYEDFPTHGVEKGMYIMDIGAPASIQYKNAVTTTHKIDKKYLPDGVTNIITANSKAELPDPSTVAEGTIALVPSEGGGGLPVVELSTVATIDGAVLSEAESAIMEKIGANSFILKTPADFGEIQATVVTQMNVMITDGVNTYLGSSLAGGTLIGVALEKMDDSQWGLIAFALNLLHN